MERRQVVSQRQISELLAMHPSECAANDKNTLHVPALNGFECLVEFCGISHADRLDIYS